MKCLVVTFLVVLVSVPAFSQSDKILGLWWTSDQGAKVEVYKSGSKYYGKIIWLREPNDSKTGKPVLDEFNPDPSKRKLPILGSVFISGFSFEDHEYVGGEVYDSRDGKTYNGKMWLTEAGTLKMRGYWGIFYNTEEMTRVK